MLKRMHGNIYSPQREVDDEEREAARRRQKVSHHRRQQALMKARLADNEVYI